MENPAALALLKTDLGHYGPVPEGVDSLLQVKLDDAEGELRDAGIVLDLTSHRDLDLLVMYAAWLYRGRIHQTDKPLMLQRLLRNRQVAKCTGGST